MAISGYSLASEVQSLLASRIRQDAELVLENLRHGSIFSEEVANRRSFNALMSANWDYFLRAVFRAQRAKRIKHMTSHS